MMRRITLGVVVVVATFATLASAGPPAKTLPSRASGSPGAFPDNPMLASIPSDTPYVFATFKPIPPAYLHEMANLLGPVYWRAFEQYLAMTPDGAREAAWLKKEFGGITLATVERLGLSAKARFAIYGLGAYPVARVELADGNRLLAEIARIAKHEKKPLPASTERGGRHYWMFDLTMEWSVVVSIAPKELVVAAAPRKLLETNLAIILGEQTPPRSLTTEDLRAVAARDGFTGQGVGYVDLGRVATLVTTAFGAPAACRTELAQLAQRAPRIAVGYGDFDAHQIAFGTIVELAPDLASALSTVQTTLAGYDRVVTTKSAFAFAAAADLDKARPVIERAALALRGVGQACNARDLADSADALDKLTRIVLPSLPGGIHGLYAIATKFSIAPTGPRDISGYAVVRADHSDALIQLLRMRLPGLDLAADGKAHPLPLPLPFAVHAAATGDSIAVALGPDSKRDAVDALRGTPVPAPLAMMKIDYAKLADTFLAGARGPDADATREMLKAFGLATMQLLADERGLVAWMSLDIR